MKRIVALLLFTLLFQTTLYARQIDDVNLPETITIGSDQLKLNGAGIREKFFLDLYIAGLYLSKANSSAEDIIAATDAKAIDLWVVSSLITSKKMENGVRKGFEKATNGNTSPISKEIDTFLNVFKKELKEGDHFSFQATKEDSVVIKKNGSVKTTISGTTFQRALFGIWLGTNPAQDSLKREMLGLK